MGWGREISKYYWKRESREVGGKPEECGVVEGIKREWVSLGKCCMEVTNKMRIGQCSLNLAIKKYSVGSALDCRQLKSRRQVCKWF